MRELCEVLGIDNIHNTPYKALTNEAVEQFLRTPNAMLGRVFSENQLEWDVKLPGVMATYWASGHDATGYSPNFLMFGRELRAPIVIVLGGRVVSNAHTRKSLLKKCVLVYANLTRWPGSNSANVPNAASICTTCAYARLNFIGTWVWFFNIRRYICRSPIMAEKLYWTVFDSQNFKSSNDCHSKVT